MYRCDGTDGEVQLLNEKVAGICRTISESRSVFEFVVDVVVLLNSPHRLRDFGQIGNKKCSFNGQRNEAVEGT